eukprot:TRINITY_DN3949_c0_g6_i1.p1 TRINITY_DN3949_c0_g6~~TRINITY_DN3949_c0_g6_i1.p1  ORF type:complete len:261 (+),score=38.76 TRINITY_DN3949_c0_g6_i1:66-848(+)
MCIRDRYMGISAAMNQKLSALSIRGEPPRGSGSPSGHYISLRTLRLHETQNQKNLREDFRASIDRYLRRRRDQSSSLASPNSWAPQIAPSPFSGVDFGEIRPTPIVMHNEKTTKVSTTQSFAGVKEKLMRFNEQSDVNMRKSASQRILRESNFRIQLERVKDVLSGEVPDRGSKVSKANRTPTKRWNVHKLFPSLVRTDRLDSSQTLRASAQQSRSISLDQEKRLPRASSHLFRVHEQRRFNIFRLSLLKRNPQPNKSTT